MKPYLGGNGDTVVDVGVTVVPATGKDTSMRLVCLGT